MSVRSRSKRTPPVVCAPVAALATIPAGPVLSAALAHLAADALTGHELVLVLQARYRQANHEQGLVLATCAQVMRRSDPHFGLADEPDSLSGGNGRVRDPAGAAEIRAALRLSRTAANALADFTTDLVLRLPGVLHALIDGHLDRPRARIFSLWTQDLSPAHTAAVVAALLDRAPELTTAELIDAIQKAAIELDPQWARRRYERRLHDRRVEGIVRPDGTADLTGYHLPADQVAAACDRLDAIAWQLKRLGHPHPIDHIRADIFIGRQDGRYNAMTDDQLLAHLIAHMPPTPATGDSDQPDVDKPTPADARSEPDVDDTGQDAADNAGQDTADAAGEEGAAGADESTVDPTTPTDDASGNGDAHPADAHTRDHDARGTDNGHGAGAGVGWVRGKGLRLLTGLGSIAGRDRRPGHLLGHGHLHAELARRISAAPHACWWYVLIEPDGTPLDVGPIRRRPTKPWYDGPTPGYRHVHVWLQLTRAELTQLLDDPPPGWTPLLADIANRIAHRPLGPPNGDPADRFPTAALRRWVHIRDQRCSFPGCRVAAHRGDIDHTRDHATGGPTVDTNLGPCCGPDHDLKTTYGWTAHQTRPGHVTWTSPLGHTYQRTPPPGPDQALTPIPHTYAPDDPRLHHQRYDNPHWHTDTCLWTAPPPPAPVPEPQPPPPPPQPDNDAIPF